MNRRIVAVVVVFLLLISVFIGLDTNNDVSASNSVVINSYECDVEVGYKTFKFKSICHFETSSELNVMTWSIASQHLKASNVKIDGKRVDFDNKSYEVIVKPSSKLKKGVHTLEMEYGGTIDVNYPPTCRLQIFSWTNHFHCYNAWFPVLKGAGFADAVKFTVDVEIPSHWYLLGSYVPEKFRDKPNPTGKYHFEIEKENIYSMKLIGGDYNIYKEKIDSGSLRVYTFKNEESDSKGVADVVRQAMKFYSEYYDHPCDDDFFICAQTGRRGNGQGLDGGFTVDSPSLASDFFVSFFTHEVAHVAWFGGNGILGSKEQPNSRFFAEAFAEFSCLLFSEEGYTGKHELNKYDELRTEFFKNRPRMSVTDPNSTWINSVIYTKGALVLWALRGYVGDTVFRESMIEIFDEYSLKPAEDTRKRITFDEFKSIIEKHHGKSIDDFWNVFFKSGQIVDVNYKIDSRKWEGKKYNYLVVINLEYPDFPLRFKLFYVDGTTETITTTGSRSDHKIEKNIVGYEFMDYRSIIPKKGVRWHTLTTSTMSSVLSWKKPLILINSSEDDETQKRAELWKNKFDGEISNTKPKILPKRPVILLGMDMQIHYLGEVTQSFPVCSEGDYLRWNSSKINGRYTTTGLVALPDCPDTPVILDTDTGELPENLNYLSIFHRKDKTHKIAFISRKVGEVLPPNIGSLLNMQWDKKTIDISDCSRAFSLEPSGNITIEYNGFDPERFVVDNTVIELGPGSHRLDLNLSFKDGVSPLRIIQDDTFLHEEWSVDFNISNGNGISVVPEHLAIPKTVKGDSIKIKWIDNLEYIYCLDGEKMVDWKRDSGLTFTNLPKGKHELKLLFIEDGLLSPLIIEEFISGVEPPTIEFDKPYALWMNGKITITGKTEPGVTLDPAGTVDADGNFEIIIEADEVPAQIKVTATNEFGLFESKTISVIKFIKLTMILGKTSVTGGYGESWELDVPPQLVNGSTYVPMRFIGERLGADVSWVGAEKKVIYRLGNTAIEIWIGKDKAFVNGISVTMPGAPVIISGRTLVPVRFVSEALGAKVSWFGNEKKIVIEYPNLD